MVVVELFYLILQGVAEASVIPDLLTHAFVCSNAKLSSLIYDYGGGCSGQIRNCGDSNLLYYS